MYFMDTLFHGNGNDRRDIPLTSIIISYMRTVVKDKRDLLWVPCLLTLLFQRAHVDFLGEQVIDLDTNDFITS